MTNDRTGVQYHTTEEVNAKVLELLGLTQQQFTQTVMIAQGDFLKILNSSSDERKKLFQKLFHTTVYEDLQKKLKEKKNECSGEREKLLQQIRFAVGDIHPEPSFADRELLQSCCSKIKENKEEAAGEVEELCQLLEKLILQEKKTEKQAERKWTEASSQIDQLTKEIERGKNLNQDFAEQEEKKKKLTELLADQESVEQDRESLKYAGKAKDAESSEILLRQTNEEITKTKEDLKNSRRQLEQAEAALPAAKKEKEETESQEEQLRILYSEAETLAGCVPVLEETGKLKKQLVQDQTRLKELTDTCSQVSREYVETQNRYYLSQAGILAEKLQPGEPCPVCGSTSHPAPAETTPESVTREKLEQKKQQWESAEGKLKEALIQTKKTETDLAGKQEQLHRMQVGEEETQESLQLLISEKKKAADNFQRKMEAAREKFQQLEKDTAAAKENLRITQERLEKLQQESRKQQDEFHDKLTACGFESEDAYQCAKKTEKEREALEKRIRDFEQCRVSLESRLKDLKNKLTDQQQTDIADLEERKEQLERNRKESADEEKKAHRSWSEHKEALEKIRKADAGIQKKRERWTTIHQLYYCCSGQSESGQKRAKLTFEAYVQQYYFHRVVAAANQRLWVLTEKQFTLRCRQEARNYQSQSGLDLEVLDQNTGRWRDVSTLSGGESFLASLALALGLSDVVQEQSGQVRIDAMFIDEGFGTLDENALQNALEVLADLSEGKRLIGIVSHVNELQERIDKQIMVTKTLNGSRIEING